MSWITNLMSYVLNADGRRAPDHASVPARFEVLAPEEIPTREWVLLFRQATDEAFVVREWPDGTITACTLSLAQPVE